MKEFLQKGNRVLAIILSQIFLFLFCFFPLKTNDDMLVVSAKPVYIVAETDYSRELFDCYEENFTAEATRITAFKNLKAKELNGIENVHLQDETIIRTAYDVEYNHTAEMIYLTISVFDQDDNFISAQCMEAYPIVVEGENVDALFEIEGKNVYLSEILTGKNENCFFFSMTLSLLAAKIVAAAIVAAKAVTVIAATVTVGYTVYKVAEITKEKIEERERTAVKQKNKSNPKVYYPAARMHGKLFIAANPVGLIAASKAIVVGTDFWSPLNYTAKNLALAASGGYIGPEIDSKKAGYYYHYHLSGRVGGHSFFGGPSGDKF